MLLEEVRLKAEEDSVCFISLVSFPLVRDKQTHRTLVQNFSGLHKGTKARAKSKFSWVPHEGKETKRAGLGG